MCLVPATWKSAQIWPTLLLDKENKWFATTANVGISWFSNCRNTFLEIAGKKNFPMEKYITFPYFGPARPERAKHCITNAFLYTFKGLWRLRADLFCKKMIFTKNWTCNRVSLFLGNLGFWADFPFLLKSVTRTNTYISFGISMIWRRVATEFCKNHESYWFYVFYGIFINSQTNQWFFDFLKIMGNHENDRPSVPGHEKSKESYTFSGFWEWWKRKELWKIMFVSVFHESPLHFMKLCHF